MKKAPKKLVLAKETLRSLGELDLKAMMVAGGYTLDDCPSSPVNICEHNVLTTSVPC